MKEIKSVNDIKSGYVFKMRNGELYMCTRCNQNEFHKIGVNKNYKWIDLKVYIGLKHIINSNYDIVEVYGLCPIEFKALMIRTENRPLLYKETLIKEVTMQEVEKRLLKQLKKESD